jgi:hypothetical protein
VQPCPISAFASYGSSVGDGASDCAMVARSETNVTCACGLTGQGGHRRRLQQNSGMTDSSEISLNIVAAGQSTAKEFVSTWTSAGDLTAQSVEDSIQVLIVVAGIAIVGVACLCYAARLDYLDEKVKASDGTGAQTADGTGVRRLSSSVAPHPGEHREMSELAETKKMLGIHAAALRPKTNRK